MSVTVTVVWPAGTDVVIGAIVAPSERAQVYVMLPPLGPGLRVIVALKLKVITLWLQS